MLAASMLQPELELVSSCRHVPLSSGLHHCKLSLVSASVISRPASCAQLVADWPMGQRRIASGSQLPKVIAIWRTLCHGDGWASARRYFRPLCSCILCFTLTSR